MYLLKEISAIYEDREQRSFAVGAFSIHVIPYIHELFSLVHSSLRLGNFKSMKNHLMEVLE